MEGRLPSAPQEYAAHYFPQDEADIAAQVRSIFAEHISMDVSQVHPSDKLVEELRMGALDSMSTVEFVMDLEKHFKIDIPNEAAAKMRTLKDITEYVSRAVRVK